MGINGKTVPGIDAGSAAAFTGHRAENLPWRFNDADSACCALRAALASAIEAAYAEGKRIFLSGMATGTDTYAAEEVLLLKRKHPDMRLVCVFPCPSNDPRALRIADSADECLLLNGEYVPGCMQQRNRFLVENSSLIIACYDGRHEGGTYQTLCLAQEKGLRIMLIGP
jgi:Uncharacterized protein conserved in bacteria